MAVRLLDGSLLAPSFKCFIIHPGAVSRMMLRKKNERTLQSGRCSRSANKRPRIVSDPDGVRRPVDGASEPDQRSISAYRRPNTKRLASGEVTRRQHENASSDLFISLQAVARSFVVFTFVICWTWCSSFVLCLPDACLFTTDRRSSLQQ